MFDKLFLQGMAVSMDTQPGYSASSKIVPDAPPTYSDIPLAPE